ARHRLGRLSTRPPWRRQRSSASSSALARKQRSRCIRHGLSSARPPLARWPSRMSVSSEVLRPPAEYRGVLEEASPSPNGVHRISRYRDDSRPDGGAAWRMLPEILADPELLKVPPVVMPRLAWRGRVSLLAAREKSGKTTLVGAGAAAHSAGQVFLD